MINNEVNNFINENKNITAGALEQLEGNIKNAVQPNSNK